ncbi:DUF1398 family protein [Paenibacillus sp. HB172176]|uniref:DUF1398 family protein n=1 Tax=Paenibacillus sp. HB172176 TaxID=2493690 RepID=UPI001439111A|nr:DUF1398 family protein [Paenibacillus sp. HB172176]
MNVEEVKRISIESKRDKWPYPKTFHALLEAGVTSYRTSVSNNHTVYEGENSQYEDRDGALASTLEVAELFQADAVRKGLEHHQKHRTSYFDFLKDMAEAGVQFYEVNMSARAICYTSGRAEESYSETIPLLN